MSNSNEEDEEKGEIDPFSNHEETPGCINIKNKIKNKKRHPKWYKRLAICSIICGCSCFAYKALEYYFKGEQKHGKEEEGDKEEADEFFQKSKKYSIIAMVTGIGIIISIIALTFLISYILTLFD